VEPETLLSLSKRKGSREGPLTPHNSSGVKAEVGGSTSGALMVNATTWPCSDQRWQTLRMSAIRGKADIAGPHLNVHY
jgi:hypothetical protein